MSKKALLYIPDKPFKLLKYIIKIACTYNAPHFDLKAFKGWKKWI